MGNSDEWRWFHWHVTNLASIPNISLLRQLAGLINESHQRNAYMENTVFLKFYGMQKTFERLRSFQGARRQPTGPDVSTAYNGGLLEANKLESTHTLVKMAQMAIHLELFVIEPVRIIMNEKSLNLSLI